MARLFTIASLILKGRRACNQAESAPLADAEWQDEFSSVYSDFHSVIVEGGARVFEAEAKITADGSQDYTLPANFLSELGVDYEVSVGGRREELYQVMTQERNVNSGVSSTRSRYYAIVGNAVRFYSAPTTGQIYYLIYVPQAQDLTDIADTTQVDVIVPAGEMFFKYSLAAIGGAKTGDPQTPYWENKAANERQKLLKWSYQRSLTNPKRKIVQQDRLVGDDRDDHSWDY